jgi:nitrogen fixation NifU-like protein
LCGDTVKVYLRIEDGVVEEISFQGEGCAICTASTSLMTESVKGRRVSEVEEIFHGFHDMLTGVAAEQGIELGKLRVFEGVREYPVRVKCATLAWHTLHAAMEGDDESVTTE